MRLAGGEENALAHVSNRFFEAFVAAVAVCLLTCAEARPRIELAIEFAPLNQALMKGFFLRKGLLI